MQMEHTGRAGALVQVVDILGHHRHVELTLPLRDCPVSRIRLGGKEGLPPVVVEPQHKRLIRLPSLRSRDVLDAVRLPEPAIVPERLQSARGAESRPRKNHDMHAGNCARFLIHVERTRKNPLQCGTR